eukprot:CAMPEP_0184866378 /NCGR_PEP_ID=MMETSP0580-20130426/22137_1 /TAXON_ID=1118495 /ORGANISM="Dactyliosolen fragilissimus" /LENGTH=758 /DNA_ID=CAMNT_0027366049 /DNA_START=237 /DNA_END=2510 /DNA_ORIENTATION=+
MVAADTGDATASNHRNYEIDIRMFIGAIVVVMSVSFGAGVFSDPSLSVMNEVKNIFFLSNSTEIKEVISTKYTTDVIGTRRAPTKHISELGKVIGLDEEHVNVNQPSLENFGYGDIEHTAPTMSPHLKSDIDGEDEEEEHLPAGQHILMDIKNVNKEFLNSDERLAAAMVDVIRSAGLTLLSYHCHSLQPMGVSCVGVLLESHISFHTWPEEGVITLDLFTCGSSPLLPVIPELKRLFGVPRLKAIESNYTSTYEEIVTLWSHELRGFRNSESRVNNALDNMSDLANLVLSDLRLEKKEIVSVISPYRRIDIWDIRDLEDYPSDEDVSRANLKPGDPRWLTNEVTSFNRVLFLDGQLKTNRRFDTEYYESLVHPAMFAHENPEKVAILGEGYGATLREVLKHNTVKYVTLVERDQMLYDLVREHFPELSDCSQFYDSVDCCFDDEKVKVLFQEPVSWVFETDQTNIDVIILERLIASSDNDMVAHMLKDTALVDNIMNSLSESGIFAIDIGLPPSIHDPRANMGAFAKREEFFLLLEGRSDVNAMFVYEEAHAGLDEPVSYLVVCKSADCRKRWVAKTEAVDNDIYSRTLETRDDGPTLKHYDGATQYLFQAPPRAWETVYCRREPEPFECAYRGLDITHKIFDFILENEEENPYRVEKNEDEYRVFSKVDIPKGSYIMPSALAANVELYDESIERMRSLIKMEGVGDMKVIQNFLSYVDQNSHDSIAEGSNLQYLEVGPTHFIREVNKEDDANIGRW